MMAELTEIFSSLFLILSLFSEDIRSDGTSVFMCDSQIYCQGPILETVNRLHIFNDSKHYVDMPLRKSPVETLTAFRKLFPEPSNISASDMKNFLNDYFFEPSGELSECKPNDWKENPASFQLIKDDTYRAWANSLHGIWLKLCRQINDTVLKDFEKNSLIYVPHKFIAPGGRFREYYYWDTYWIIRGLLVSEMYDTAKDIIRNFAYLIGEHGFIPNGGRVYYLQRSQPPFFIPMVYEYFTETNDFSFLKEMLPYMAREFSWWTANRTVTVTKHNKTYTVYRYHTPTNTPRPEMWRNDVELAEQVANDDKPYLYQNIASGAEGGLDFGSRYFADAYKMSTIRIIDILPVDLNAILCWNIDMLHLLNIQAGNLSASKEFLSIRDDMREMMEAIFYNNSIGAWFDVDYKTNIHRTHFYASNALPLFTGCYNPLDKLKPRRFYDYMKEAGAFGYPSGIPSSLVETGQQWDLPNGWAPQNHIIIEGFRKSGHQEMQEHAYQIAEAWLKVNYLVFVKTTHMYEKYNVSDTTYQPGGGGEYEVQAGFGWTNGVVLDLLRTYGARLIAPVDNKPLFTERPPTKYAYHNLPSRRLCALSGIVVVYLILGYM